MKSLITKEQFRRYLTNACSPAEKQAVDAWLTDPVNDHQAQAWMAEHWNDVDADDSPDLDHLLQALDHHIQAETEEAVDAPMRKRKLFATAPWKMAAAFLVLAVSAGILYLLVGTGSSTPDMTGWQTKSTVATREKVTHVTLPDGSTVWLNAKSEIRYAAEFGSGRREVFLTGEAYFDVTEDKHKPFIVYTQDIQIRVLGTAFNVKAYHDDQTSETTLVRGKVVVEKKGRFTKSQTLELVPNQRAVFTRVSSDLMVSTVAAEQSTSWKSGVLIFDNELITNVLPVLERWYNVTITLEQAAGAACTLTAEIGSESLEETLDLLATANGVDYTISGNEVIIKGQICK